jgi:hypothetical protein
MAERPGAAPAGPATAPAAAPPAVAPATPPAVSPAASPAVSPAISPGGSAGGRAAVVPGAGGRAVGAGKCGECGARAGTGTGAARHRPLPRGRFTATAVRWGPAHAAYGIALAGGRGRRVCGARTACVRVSA